MKRELLLEKIEEYKSLMPWFVLEYYQSKLSVPYSFTTLYEYLKEYKRFFDWLIDSDISDTDDIASIDIKTLENLTKKDMESFVLYLRERPSLNTYSKKQGVSQMTINRTLSALSSLYKYLTEEVEGPDGEPYFYRNVMKKISTKKKKETLAARAENIKQKLFLGDETMKFLDYVENEYEVKLSNRAKSSFYKNKERDLAIIALLLIGPLGIWIGSAISALVYTIHSYLGWLSVAIMGALWPLLVMTGMHRVFTPTIIQTIAETGKEGMVMPSEIGANLSLGGSSLAVAWKTKNPELRQTALAAAASAIMAGISEPALYGVAIRLKRPLIASLISGFICGAVAGMAGLASHSMAAPGLFTSVQFFDPANPMTIVWVFGVMALAVVLSFVLTLILGFEDIPVEDAAAQARKNQAAQPGNINGASI